MTVRKKKKTVATPLEEKKVELPERGPWCPACQWEYTDARKLSAFLAVEAELAVDCPECDEEHVPVMVMPQERPAKGPPKRPPLEPGVKAIIDTIFEVDYAQTWKVLQEQLVIGEDRTDHGTVVQHLDHAEDNARKAHQLYVNMRLDQERYEIDTKIVWAALYDEAHARLQAQKAKGERSKQITDGDVAYKMAELHPDEFRAYEIEKKRFDLAVKHAETLAELWSSKARSLNTILSRMRGGGVA